MARRLLIVVGCMVLLAFADRAHAGSLSPDDLLAGFADPPDSSKPHVWWHWMNGNVTRDGILRDLQALRENGFGGATIVDAGLGPRGQVAFATDRWYDAVAYAVGEAKRLGLEITLPNCSGWSSSGGPWIDAAHSMKKIVFTETIVDGPRSDHVVLPRFADDNGFYEDIAVIAFPVPKADDEPLPDPRIERSAPDDWTRVTDFSYAEDVKVSAISLELAGGCDWIEQAEVAVERDVGGRLDKVAAFRFPVTSSGVPQVGVRSFSFTPTTARRFLVTVRSVRSYPPRNPRKPYELKSLALERKFRLPNLESKAVFASGDLTPCKSHADTNQVVQLQDVRVLRCGSDGRVDFKAQPGRWALMRVGYVANGMRNHPASPAGYGFECDKLDRSALDLHFDAYVGKMVEQLKSRGLYVPGNDSGLTTVLVDSYEVGKQNWTHGFELEFRRRCGYDLLPYLCCLSGRIVGDVETTERVLADFRRVIGELFVANYAEAMAERCHRLGLKFQLEPYGDMPCEAAAYALAADLPTGEFWIGRDFSLHRKSCCRPVVLAARKRGCKIVGAEAFTSDAYGDHWSMAPFDLKSQGDFAFRAGINRFYLHSFVHQPREDLKPGMTMSKFGTHFDRHSTWWPQAREWVRYLTRCQYLLQEGEPLAETAYDTPHRRYADGTEGFFIAVTNMTAVSVAFNFPVVDRVPELWDPSSGEVRIPREWKAGDKETRVTVDFDPCGSVFVMFRPTVTAKAKPQQTEDLRSERTLEGPWRLSIAKREVELQELQDWTTFSDPDLRYFSGTAEYRMKFSADGCDGRTVLDLGDVRNLATVIVNGHEYPSLWKPPYRIDVTDSLQSVNDIRVRVTNLWANRLIGDAGLPKSQRTTHASVCRWKADDKPLASGLLGPVRLMMYGDADGETPGVKVSERFGYDPVDATAFVQAALVCTGKRLL